MRRLVVAALVAGQLAIGTGTPLAAETPSPEPTPSASGVQTGGRFVSPEGGYAVTFPEGWRVEIHPDEDDPTEIPYVDAQASRADPASGAAAYCWIRAIHPCGDGAVGPCASLIDEAAAQEVAWWESGKGGLVPAEVESVVLDLPAGYAVRVRVESTDPDRDRSYYRITDGQALAILGCHAAHGPDDHWLSIAASFEFLPVAE